MNEEAHISGAVSALVMLAAIATTYNVYSLYRDEQVAVEYESAQVSMENTASALLSLRIEKAASAPVATTTATTTTDSKQKKN